MGGCSSSSVSPKVMDPQNTQILSLSRSKTPIEEEEKNNKINEIDKIPKVESHYMPNSQDLISKYFIIVSSDKETNFNIDQTFQVNWKKVNQIAHGPKGKIYKGTNIKNGQTLAIKSLKLMGDSIQFVNKINDILKLIEKFRKLKNQKILTYYSPDIFESKNKIKFVMEYVPTGSIQNLLEKYGPLNDKLIKIYSIQILEILEYIHLKGLTHGNLKSSNILIDLQGNIKLCDYIFTGKETIYNKNTNILNTDIHLWKLPQILKEDSELPSTDILLFGCILIEMATGVFTVKKLSINFHEIFKQISFKSICSNDPIKTLGMNFQKFLEKIFVANPKERASANSLLTEPFILQDDDLSSQMSIKRENLSPTMMDIANSGIDCLKARRRPSESSISEDNFRPNELFNH